MNISRKKHNFSMKRKIFKMSLSDYIFWSRHFWSEVNFNVLPNFWHEITELLMQNTKHKDLWPNEPNTCQTILFKPRGCTPFWVIQLHITKNSSFPGYVFLKIKLHGMLAERKKRKRTKNESLRAFWIRAPLYFLT